MNRIKSGKVSSRENSLEPMDLPSIKKLILVQPTCMAGSSSFLIASIKGRMTGLSLGGSVCMVTKAPAMSDNTLNNEMICILCQVVQIHKKLLEIP
jgi:hypothetical protein